MGWWWDGGVRGVREKGLSEYNSTGWNNSRRGVRDGAWRIECIRGCASVHVSTRLSVWECVRVRVRACEYWWSVAACLERLHKTPLLIQPKAAIGETH